MFCFQKSGFKKRIGRVNTHHARVVCRQSKVTKSNYTSLHKTWTISTRKIEYIVVNRTFLQNAQIEVTFCFLDNNIEYSLIFLIPSLVMFHFVFVHDLVLGIDFYDVTRMLDINDVFNLFDVDRSGSVSIQELLGFDLTQINNKDKVRKKTTRFRS